VTGEHEADDSRTRERDGRDECDQPAPPHIIRSASLPAAFQTDSRGSVNRHANFSTAERPCVRMPSLVSVGSSAGAIAAAVPESLTSTRARISHDSPKVKLRWSALCSSAAQAIQEDDEVAGETTQRKIVDARTYVR
jgi:hypothetical protein